MGIGKALDGCNVVQNMFAIKLEYSLRSWRREAEKQILVFEVKNLFYRQKKNKEKCKLLAF
jgi:hypothetical protein